MLIPGGSLTSNPATLRIAMSRPGIGGMGIIDVVYGAIYDDSTFLFPPHCKERWRRIKGPKWVAKKRKQEVARSSSNLNLLLVKAACPGVGK